MNPDDTILALRRENSILRALLPRLGAPCPYCGLVEMGKCPRGFPGCSYADDLLCGEDEHARGLLEEVRELRRRLGQTSPESTPRTRSSNWVPANIQNPSQT